MDSCVLHHTGHILEAAGTQEPRLDPIETLVIE